MLILIIFFMSLVYSMLIFIVDSMSEKQKSLKCWRGIGLPSFAFLWSPWATRKWRSNREFQHNFNLSSVLNSMKQHLKNWDILGVTSVTSFVSFCVWLFPLSMVSSRSTHAITNGRIFLFHLIVTFFSHLVVLMLFLLHLHPSSGPPFTNIFNILISHRSLSFYTLKKNVFL